MGVDHYDCCECGERGIHHDYVAFCEDGHCFCDDCVEHCKLQKNEDDDADYAILNCPKCKEEEETSNNKKMLDKLLEMYNKKRKNKISLDDLKKLI